MIDRAKNVGREYAERRSEGPEQIIQPAASLEGRKCHFWLREATPDGLTEKADNFRRESVRSELMDEDLQERIRCYALKKANTPTFLHLE